MEEEAQRLAVEARIAEEERLRKAIEAEEQRKKEEAERLEQERKVVSISIVCYMYLPDIKS